MSNLYHDAEKFVIDSFNKSGGADQINHFKRTVYWLKKLKPGADEAMQIAAIAHDIERAFRSASYSTLKTARKGFSDEVHLTHHQETGANIIEEFLGKKNISKRIINKVKSLISKHEVGGNQDQDILKDADSISYFENQIDHFLSNFVKEMGKDKVKDKFNWMFERITLPQAKKIAIPMYIKALKKLEEY